MSVLRNEYDLEKHIDEVWYSSSNVIYSRFEEDEDENKGNLYVIFKGGKQYLYKSVSYRNYLSFKNGITDGSSGKALNEYIIKVYKAEKLEDADLNLIVEKLHSPKPEENTYFIHGNSDNFSEDIFQAYYAPTIDYVLEFVPECKFITVFDDKYGMRSVDYLLNGNVEPEKISIFLRVSQVEDIGEKYNECKLVKLRDRDCEDSEFIDTQLIKRSVEDIAYVSPEELGKIYGVSRPAYIMIKRRML